MNLGDFFSDDFKKIFAKRNVNLGSSILIKVDEVNVDYPKYIIVIGTNDSEDKLGYVIINSKTNTNVFRTKYLQGLNIEIHCSDHPFLEWDSTVDCTDIKEFILSDVVTFITNNPDKLVGNLTDLKLIEVLETINQASTISRELKIKYSILDSLKNAKGS